MKNLSTPNNSLVLSYLGLRKAIGIIGIALPFVLVFGKIILSGPGIEVSISSYYYTVMRDVFVGSLCAIGVFLVSYRGYELVDDIAGKFATIFAVGTAFFPTRPANASAHQITIGNFHIFFSVSLFLTLAFFALVLFRKTDPTKTPTIQKQKRNIIYTVCGFGILACMVLALSLKLLPSDSLVFNFSPLFWLESSAIILFGISWLVKGEAILTDVVR
ncbi:MAG TPA: DUF998 domain-containing protein [Patescibacteria group bacterium]